MLAWIHPILAVLTLAALAHEASLGARARNDRRHRARHLARHAAIAPWMFAAVAASWHFRFGIALVAVLGLSAITARSMNRRAVRELHPWIGVAALLLAAAQVFFGLQKQPKKPNFFFFIFFP